MSQPDASTAPRPAGNAIDEFLRAVVGKRGSDLHFVAGEPARVRLYGDLQPLASEVLTAARTEEVLLQIMSAAARADFEKRDSTDFAYAVEGVARFRVNVFRHLGGMGAVFRSIPSQAKTLKDLDLPAVLSSLARQPQGMILVTGKTGSGKSTTLAAIIDEINNRETGHILTIEDPIEFTHPNKKCLVNQREIGASTRSFANALRAALREDPDVILVGEMRDRETIELGITAAETGHLVFGTLHTNSAPKTVDRIIDVFPTDQQDQIRSMLAESLRGVISQLLLRTKDGKGRVAAQEIMVGTSAVSNLIRENKLHQIPSIIQTGKKDGMQLMDQHIMEHFMSGRVDAREAYMKANNKALFRPHLEGDIPPQELG